MACTLTLRRLLQCKCISSPFPLLFLPSLVMGEKGTSVRSLSEGEGDSTEREVICGVRGRSEAAPEPPGEEALELGP